MKTFVTRWSRERGEYKQETTTADTLTEYGRQLMEGGTAA